MASYERAGVATNTVDEGSEKQPKRASQILGCAGSKYKHMFGTENPKSKTFFYLQLSSVATDGPMISCSSAYWAVPYAGGGGPVYVSPLDNFGKVEPGCTVLNGHKSAVQDIAFSPFKPSLMATGSLDCTTNIWDVTKTEMAPLQSLSTHRNSVRTVNFHPIILSLLVTSSLDQTLRFYDVESSAELNCLNFDSFGPDAVVNNIAFSYDGSTLAIASRDKAIRICDPRASVVCSQVVKSSCSGSTSLSRNSRLAWIDNGSSNTILTTSSLSNGQRMVALWDVRGSTAEPIVQKCVDTSSGQLFPLLDDSTGLCFLVGKGDTVVKYYETNFLEEVASPFVSVDKANEFQTSREPFAGVAMLPKSVCNVQQVECARLLKLTSDSVIPLSFYVPRADSLKEYFQDDLYPPIRSSSMSNGTIKEWSSNADSCSFSPVLESLQPLGMIPLSQRPAEARRGSSKMDAFREQAAKEEAEKQRREQELKRLQDLANQHAKYNPNLSMNGGGGDVEEDEWDD